MGRLSTANPDLSGLWSCSLLGGKASDDGPLSSLPRPLRKLIGAVVLLALTGCWVFGGTFPFAIVLLLFLPAVSAKVVGTLLLAFMLVPYLVNIRPWPQASRFWLLAAEYFDGGCSMSYEEERSPNNTTSPHLIAYHPHGIFTFGVILNSGFRASAASFDPASPYWSTYVGKKCGEIPYIGLAARALNLLPLMRPLVVQWTGCISSADKANFTSFMSNGTSCGLIPGGFLEASLHVKGRERVYFGKSGFIYYALKYGYKVVPAYTFGESDTYFNVPGFWKIRKWLSKFGIPTILVTGPISWVPWLALLPYGNGGLHTIHGPGKQFPKIENPTKEQVEEYHLWHKQEIKRIFDTHKHRFGIENELEIVS